MSLAGPTATTVTDWLLVVSCKFIYFFRASFAIDDGMESMDTKCPPEEMQTV